MLFFGFFLGCVGAQIFFENNFEEMSGCVSSVFSRILFFDKPEINKKLPDYR